MRLRLERKANMTDPAQEAQARKYLMDSGKCASKSMNGHLCTISANHIGRKHKAQVLGGVDDGRTLEEWDW